MEPLEAAVILAAFVTVGVVLGTLRARRRARRRARASPWVGVLRDSNGTVCHVESMLPINHAGLPPWRIEMLVYSHDPDRTDRGRPVATRTRFTYDDDDADADPRAGHYAGGAVTIIHRLVAAHRGERRALYDLERTLRYDPAERTWSEQ